MGVEELTLEVITAARRLARRYSAAFRRDPRLRDRLARLFRRHLPGARPPGTASIRGCGPRRRAAPPGEKLAVNISPRDPFLRDA